MENQDVLDNFQWFLAAQKNTAWVPPGRLLMLTTLSEKAAVLLVPRFSKELLEQVDKAECTLIDKEVLANLKDRASKTPKPWSSLAEAYEEWVNSSTGYQETAEATEKDKPEEEENPKKKGEADDDGNNDAVFCGQRRET
eukprot:5556823-Lingulodinium_polyedra.AAC.1